MQSRPGSRAGSCAGDPGTLVCVGPRVQRVEHGQLRVVDNQDGVINGIGCILLGPVRVGGRNLGVQLIGPLVDLCLDVLCTTSAGRSIGTETRCLTLSLPRRTRTSADRLWMTSKLLGKDRPHDIGRQPWNSLRLEESLSQGGLAHPRRAANEIENAARHDMILSSQPRQSGKYPPAR
jgi:hypothetical protein